MHGVAVSHGNLGFLKFYNPLEYDLSVVYQAVEYELAKEIGDFGRTGIAMNKIGEPWLHLISLLLGMQFFEQLARGKRGGRGGWKKR